MTYLRGWQVVAGSEHWARFVVNGEAWIGGTLVYATNNRWFVAACGIFETREEAMAAADRHLLHHGYAFLPEKLELLI